MSKKLHIGLIPDGARRWSNERKISLDESYKRMVENVFRLINYLLKKDTSEITIYFSSIDNFSRSEEEITSFCNAEAFFFSNLFPVLDRNFNININFIGKIEIVPEKLKNEIKNLQTHRTKGNYTLNFCIAYCPYFEIERALSVYDFKGGVKDSLLLKSPIDIVIRTGNQNCISNFMPLQSGYARLYFSDKLINDFNKKDLDLYLKDFNSTKRKFGK